MHGMHGNSHHLAFDKNYPDKNYPGTGRTYSGSVSRSSSEYLNYHPQHDSISSYGSSQKHPPWSKGSAAAGFDRGVGLYDTSTRSTELREYPTLYSSDTDVWPSSSDPSWNNVRLPGIDSFDLETIQQDHLHLPSIVSGSPQLLSALAPLHGPPRSTKAIDTNVLNLKMCSHCHVTSSPLWRRDPSTHRTLCNACGLYLQQHGRLRPQELINADINEDNEEPQLDSTGPQCSHCCTRNTSVWRRSKTGQKLCNACGVYARLRGRDRPLSLKRNKIKPRTKLNKLSADK